MTPGGKAAVGVGALSPLGLVGLVVVIVAVAVGGAPPPGTGGTIAGVDPTVAAAYTSAAAKVGNLVPGCRVPLPLIAAIGQIESNHAAGRTVATTGEVTPPIIGIALNGSRGTAAIADTDGGRLDGDTVWDRAVGPMQFIPSTWAGSGADGNSDGINDPNNISDAALATAAYLCRAVPGSDLTSDADQRRAVFAYNRSAAYVDKVMGAAAVLAAAVTAGAGGAVLIVATGGPLQLATVDGITVAASLAPNLARLLEASAAAGLRLGGGGYRSAAQQIALRRTNGCPDIYNSPASACRPPTARPGQSMHEQGLAIDFTCSGTLITSRFNPCFQWWQTTAHPMVFITLPVSFGTGLRRARELGSGSRLGGRNRGGRVAFVARETHGRGDDRCDLTGRGMGCSRARSWAAPGSAGTLDGPCGAWARCGGGRSVMGGRRLGVVVGVVGLVALSVVMRGGSHRPPPTTVAAEPVWPAQSQVEAEASTTAAALTTAATPSAVESGVADEAEADAAALEAGGEEEVLAPADQWRSLLATDATRAGLYRLIGDPASSDLPPAVAGRAASTGSVFVVADATGVGREAFPSWWGERPPMPVAATARVLAAGAASYGPVVQVVVVWDGAAPDGGALGERTSTVFLDSASPEVFVPVHPGDLG